MVELGISFEEHDGSENKSIENKSVEVEEKTSSKEEEGLSEEKNIISQEDTKEDLESIESIPFISDPPKKKITKRKKASV